MLRRDVGLTYFVAHRFNGGLRTGIFLEFRRACPDTSGNGALKMYAPFLRNSETNFDIKPTVETVGYKMSRAYGSA